MSTRSLALVTVAGLCLAAGAWGAQQADPVVTTLTIFAGTAEGPWLSRDWGGSWERLESGDAGGDDPQEAGATFSFLPLGPRVYMGGTGGLFVSEDFGQIWARREVEVEVLGVLPSRYPQSDPTVFLATATGLLKSVDEGRSFTPTALTETAITRLEWPGPALVVATERGVLVSDDGGNSFSGPGEGLPPGRVHAMALSSFYPVDPVLFAAVGTEGVFRSADGGQTWAGAGLAGKAVTDMVWLGPFLYAVTADGVLRSQDLGKSWTRLAEGLDEAKPYRVLFPLAPESGAVLFLATDRGIYRSSDGGEHWTRTGFEERPVLCIATFPPPLRAPND